MAWLDDHPPRTQQYRCPRRENPSGVVGVHTAESFPDEVGPDDGAENVADFIRRRSNYGSYHDLADSDSIINLVRYGCVSYHIAPHGMNEHSYGVSAATQAHKWPSLDPQWVDATIRNMARASARYARWLQRHYGITIPARRLTLAQARRREPGFIAHGDADPQRRTDPGDEFPWGRFLDYYAQEMGDDEMVGKIEAPNGEDWNVEHAMSWIMGRLHELSPWGDYVTTPSGEKTWSLPHAITWLMSREKEQRGQLPRILANQQAIMAAQGVEVDETAIAQQISAVLVPAVIEALPDTGLTEAEVEDASERAVRAVLGSLDSD